MVLTRELVRQIEPLALDRLDLKREIAALAPA
jgi:hypothetical protein